FFSSRRRHTRFKCDWSSDVCSSDLTVAVLGPNGAGKTTLLRALAGAHLELHVEGELIALESDRCVETHSQPSQRSRMPMRIASRSEERRVGKECRTRRERPEERKKR